MSVWSPYNDSRTNAELRARHAELCDKGNRSRAPEEGAQILRSINEIEVELEERRMHGMPEDWVHPRHGEKTP